MGLHVYIKTCFHSNSYSQWIAPSLPPRLSVISQQKLFKPVSRKAVGCHFSGFRVLKLGFKPAVSVFAVLLFPKSLITGNDGLFNGIKCSQTFFSMAAHASGFSTQVVVPVVAHGCSEHIAGLLTPSSPQGRRDRAGPAGLVLFQPVDVVFVCLSKQHQRCVTTAQKYTHIRMLSVCALFWRWKPNQWPAV